MGTTLSRGWTPPSQRLEPFPVKTSMLLTALGSQHSHHSCSAPGRAPGRTQGPAEWGEVIEGPGEHDRTINEPIVQRRKPK